MLYDILIHEMECPFCKTFQQFEVEIRFSSANSNLYKIDDKIIEDYRSLKKTNFIIEGYAQCEFNCKKDFFVDIEVKNKTITKIHYDKIRKGYVK